MATEGEEGDKAPVRPAGKFRFKRFRDSAELAILLASLVLAGVSVYQSRQAGAAADAAVEAAEDANAAAREANGISSDLGTIDALLYQGVVRGSVPRVLIDGLGNNGNPSDGYAQATGWNPSSYPAIVLGADLDFTYSNVEGDNEFSNAALERTTIESCRLQVWSPQDDGTVGSTSVACTEPVSVGPGDILWVSAGIPEGQKKTFCIRHPKGIAGFEISVRHALYNVSNELPEADPPVALSLSCEHHIFPEPP